jgi:hypothetical protein
MDIQCSQKLADSVQAPIKKNAPLQQSSIPMLKFCSSTNVSSQLVPQSTLELDNRIRNLVLKAGRSKVQVWGKNYTQNTTTNLTTLDTVRLSCNKPCMCMYYFLSHCHATCGNTTNCTYTEIRTRTLGNCSVMKNLPICKCQQEVTRPLLCSQPACLPQISSGL